MAEQDEVARLRAVLEQIDDEMDALDREIDSIAPKAVWTRANLRVGRIRSLLDREVRV